MVTVRQHAHRDLLAVERFQQLHRVAERSPCSLVMDQILGEECVEFHLLLRNVDLDGWQEGAQPAAALLLECDQPSSPSLELLLLRGDPELAGVFGGRGTEPCHERVNGVSSRSPVIQQRTVEVKTDRLVTHLHNVTQRFVRRACPRCAAAADVNLDPSNRRLEIGSTWLGKDAQRTGINIAAKLLLLTRAFEHLDALAVEFRVHWHNHQSRAAVEQLGAKQDGVLRKHTIFENGTIRDTVVFSIVDDEWPTVKFALQQKLTQ